MNYIDIKQVFQSTSSLTMASYFTNEEQLFLSSEVTLSNFPFGKSDKDSIQISVFAFDGNLITSSYFVPSGEYIPFTKSYYDVFNKYTEYSYSSYQSDIVIVGEETKSVFLDVAEQLNDMGVQDGNYKVGIQLNRDIVGSHSNPNQRLLIDVISTSRTEVSLIPQTIRGQVDSLVNEEFYAFSSGSVMMRDVVDNLISGISKPEMYKIFYASAAQNPDGANRFMFDYGLKKGVDSVNFLIDIYYGVKKGNRRSDGQFSTNDVLGIFDQFANWAYQNYNGTQTLKEIETQYYSLFRYIADRELNYITNKKPDDYDKVIEFLSSIYYQAIFYPIFSKIKAEYINYISGYFKNFVNINDKLYAILNTKVVASTDSTQHDRLVLKLSEPLPTEIVRGQSTWIVNTFASAPILQNVYFFLQSVINLIKLRGPNLLSKFENEGNSTEMMSIEELIGETGSLYDEVLSKLEKKSENPTLRYVDYRYFENFVNFSSANLRLQSYGYKLDTIKQLESDIADLTSKLVLQPNDEFYLTQLTNDNSEIDSIKSSFDGYESFLYLNDAWYSEHLKDYGGVSSASLYDANNKTSLINNVPTFMLENTLNDDYIKFVGMIGHYFDNISLIIKQFTDKNDTSPGPNDGISLEVVHDALVSLGWDPEISKENLPLLLGSFSKSDFSEDSPLYDKVGSISENDRNKVIWKRLLNTLPFIYKTKGTQASINAIISCFGIPKNLIKIKEYGSIDQSQNEKDQGLYVFEELKYEPYFSGSGEYFNLPWTGSVNSVEFNLRFDSSKISSDGQVFRLVSCEDNWVVGVYRERGLEWGKVFLSIDDGTGSISTTMTQKIPLFDGNSYTVLLRKDDVGNPVEYPTEYELLVKKSDGGRIVFSASSSLILSGSYNNVFKSGNNLYFGNYHQSVPSFGIDPEAFWGNLDEIKLWEIPVDNNSFDSHTLHQGAYNYSDPDTMVDKLIARVSFNQPIDLNGSIGSSSFSNLAFRVDFPTIVAFNFPIQNSSPSISECPAEESSSFPYQFSINNTIQSAQVASYGSQTMRSNKIAYINQVLVSALSPDGRSTDRAVHDMSVDSNKIGVFFSPIDSQNEEILKFFGNYNFGDLIGDPQLTYQSSYREFEKFRQIYYSQGFGIVDYQTFMNVVRSYFDKSMFKYISSVVPARSKLISGILVEPSILERPKIQLKPIVRDNIDQELGLVNFKETIRAKNVGQQTGSIFIGYRGTSILNDVNQRFYGDVPDQYGFSAYSNNGVYYYNNEYYRVDVTTDKKSYQTQRNCTLPKSKWNDYERRVDLNGSVQTISRSYYQLNLVKLPIVTEHTFTASWAGPGAVDLYTWYFSGSISIPLDYASGLVGTSISIPHTIFGMTSGSLYGFRNGDSSHQLGTIVKPMTISASFYHILSDVLYAGFYNEVSGGYTFEGNIIITPPSEVFTTSSIYHSSQFHASLISSSPTSSIYFELITNTTQSGSAGLFTNTKEIQTRKNKSLEIVPNDRRMLVGYFPTHYKYKKQVFSQKEINSIENSYDQNGKSSPRAAKWKRGSQNKRTTIDASTGNLNNTDPLERKTA